MSNFIYTVLALALSAAVLYGIHLMNSPKTAIKGNRLGAISMALAILITLWKDGTLSMTGIWISMMIGSGAGLWMASRVKMIQMPQMVALLNGFGGAASALVALLVLTDSGAPTLFIKMTAGLALAIGAITLSGSLIAAGKLHQVLGAKPIVFNRHSALCTGNMAFLLLVLFIIMASSSNTPIFFTLVMLLGSLGFGVLFTVRVGGADMPITISLLNSLSGVAGAIAGMSIGDALLVAVGGIVGASGLLLTQIMCRAMNRSLMDILLGKTTMAGKASAPITVTKSTPAAAPAAPAKSEPKKDSLAERMEQAKNVVIIPGYGMALAQAQHKVRDLAEAFEKRGATVSYAIHPVAGRMPGHMNVLLAEANVDYEKLMEMDAANEALQKADLAIIVGANDVVNPAARHAEGTPIYGMPVLMADAAKHVIVCNFDTKPGYAGVENPLYTSDKATMLLGDANETVQQLLTTLSSVGKSPAAAESGADALGQVMGQAKSVVIIPGYGMALAQAQHKVRDLAEAFEKRGATVSYAIHPVAGRMPGHMNVLLAEANVDYEKLMEMDASNEALQKADLAVIVGANDVVNPAARHAEGTPIYGMPVLMADAAQHVIICNFDTKPGYAGVENPLYTSDKATMLLGDANETVQKLLTTLNSAGTSAAPAAAADKGADALGQIMGQAKNVVIIPGYGMALAQAQHKVRDLAEAFEKRGATVSYAIHPVAGRMPGHMNVLLAEANVDYEKLMEMDASNEALQKADLAVIVGANDVVNPAARHAEGTPIYGMPVLMADAAQHVIICNFDTKPGYAGVENPLYTSDKATMLLGDANETVQQLLTTLSSAGTSATAPAAAADKGADLGQLLGQAKNVVIIPGYGMALAQAQHKVRDLAEAFEKRGATVSYAIHPVAGRMPGHMNVLLAEANVDYEKLMEMDASNEALQKADLAVIVGANDVVNPAARHAEGTPIYGMPVLMADAAKHVIICNFDTKPGYAGVENPLYTSDQATMLLGDANETVQQLLTTLSSAGTSAPAPAAAADKGADLTQLLGQAKNVVIIPGYGMALAQAQHKVRDLAEAFEKRGATVSYAIHPVAGRMPGHMNVLLAEANVDYEKLMEMDASNEALQKADLAVIVGANDVVNPAARHAEGTPIYGMPVLMADAAKHVIICNFDTKPGYAGVENPLYTSDKTTLLLGDANETVDQLIGKVRKNS